jgi:hypothetical protein
MIMSLATFSQHHSLVPRFTQNKALLAMTANMNGIALQITNGQACDELF